TVHTARQPANYAGMQPLGAHQALVEPWLQPVQQFPGQRCIGLRITVSGGEAPRLVGGEYLKVRSCVAAAQLPARAGWVLRCDHRPRPSSYRSPRLGLNAIPLQAVRA